jgi:uncharacterized ubiquitin-like protein YukD
MREKSVKKEPAEQTQRIKSEPPADNGQSTKSEPYTDGGQPIKAESSAESDHPTKPEPAKMQVFVRFLDGRTISFLVTPKTTIDQMEQLIEAREFIRADKQRLIFDNKRVGGDTCLADYNIGNGDTLQLVTRLAGS